MGLRRPEEPGARSIRRPGTQRWLIPAVLAVALAFECGCSVTGPRQWIQNGLKVGPNYGKPAAPVASAWIYGDDSHVQSSPLPNDDWWSVFGDPALHELIQAAYEQNPDLRVTAARVLEARAGQAISVGNLLPQSQQASASYSRIQLNPNMPFINQLGKVLPPGSVPSSFSNWFYGFNLSWELDLWGRLRRNVESTNAALDASVEDYDAALVTLFADVATNYVQYRVAQQRIKIARDNVRIQEGVLALASEKFRVGTTSKLDVEQARTVLEQTRSTIPALEIQQGRANDSLCILVGIPPRDLQEKLGPGPGLGNSPMPSTPDRVAMGIPADLLRRRPDVRSAERQVAAQSAQIGVAEADLYPTLFINGTIGWDAQDFSKAFATKSFLGLLTPGFRWNILNYGRILNNIHLQEARTHELVAAYQSRALSAGREVQVSLRSFLKSREQAEALDRSVAAAAEARQIGVAQYRAGTIDFNRVFNLATTQVQQQDQLAAAQGEIALGLIGVYRALGGGWELRLQKELPPASPPVAPGPPSGPAPLPEGLEPADRGPLVPPTAPPRPDPLPAPLPDRRIDGGVLFDGGDLVGPGR